MSSIYLDLREQALKTTSAEAGAPADARPEDPYGVVMDLARPNGHATVVAMAGGHASIYFSGGGGNIGGEGQPAINAAARRAVGEARGAIPRMHVTHEFSLPAAGDVQFYVLTKSVVRTARVAERALHNPIQPLNRLYIAMQDVITKYRLFRRVR